MEILTIIGYIFLSVGAIFLLLGGLGILRMPDYYTRVQAGTKASTLGAMSTIIGVAFLQPDWTVKLLVILMFIAFTNPLSSHVLARATYKMGQKPLSKENIDAYEEVDHSSSRKQNTNETTK
jgi:multicomponent Na+:H+ antiporter subunit G